MGTKPQGRNVQPVNIVGTSPSTVVNVIIVGVTPGATVQDEADAVVPVGGSVDITLTPPANPRRVTVQVTGPAGAAVRVRKQGDPAGTGILLFYSGAKEYGGEDGAIPAALTAQDVSSPAVGATVAVVWEAN